ncbi:hypothetical protein C8T65DRAFT_255971 [Cerioporus squamosus]|nr:hypothetical protein C8T65DRAFT_255971 [Cerioporus squamosus]
MSTVDVKQGRPQSLDSTYSPAPSARQSIQSTHSPTPELVGDGKTSPSLSAVGHVKGGNTPQSGVQHAAYAQSAEVEGIKHSVRRLEVRLDQEGTLISKMKQQVDRLDAKIDHVLEKVLPNQFASVDARFDDIEKTMNERFEEVSKNFRQVDDNFEAVDQRFDRLENEIQSMRDDIRLIMRMLQIQQGAPTQSPPRIVEYPPSSDSHDAASGHARSRYTSDASQLSAAGPSSPRRHQGPSVDAGDDEISLSSSKRETSQLFRTIRRMASRGSEILSKKKKGKGGVQ